MMARLMRFYHGLTVSDYDSLSWERRKTLTEFMEHLLAQRGGAS